MYKRELTIGQNVLSIETGKLAKQANGSVIVRYGDTVVLVTACYASADARGHRLPAAHGRLPRIHLRVGAHPRRLLQARGQARREGSPDEPPASTARSARCSRPAGTTRRRSSRWSCRPTPRTTRTSSRSPAPRPRWRSRRSRSRRRSPACASAWWTTSSWSTRPTSSARRASSTSSSPAASDGIVMVEAGAKESPRRRSSRRSRWRTPPSSRSSTMIDRMAQEAGKKKLPAPQKEISHDFYREVEEKVLLPLSEAMQHRGQARELRGGGPGPRGTRRGAARRRSASAGARRRRSSRN